MVKYVYICTEGASNKHWTCEVNDSITKVWYGRIGDSIPNNQPQIKQHLSKIEAQKFYIDKAREKLKKGYILSDQNNLKSEIDKAKKLGPRNKIKTICYISNITNKLVVFDTNYDPIQGVYVEIMDSWSKDIIQMIISKSTAFRITGQVKENKIHISTSVADHTPFVTAIRDILNDIAGQVKKVIDTFAGLSGRALDIGIDPVNIDFSKIIAANSAIVDAGVIIKFAGLGARNLEL